MRYTEKGISIQQVGMSLANNRLSRHSREGWWTRPVDEMLAKDPPLHERPPEEPLSRVREGWAREFLDSLERPQKPPLLSRLGTSLKKFLKEVADAYAEQVKDGYPPIL